MEYYQVWFSAEDKMQAETILRDLVEKKLIVGGTVLNGPSMFWWNQKQINMDYYYIMGFTLAKNRDAIEKAYEDVSVEDVPMASFVKMEGNTSFLDFITKYTS